MSFSGIQYKHLEVYPQVGTLRRVVGMLRSSISISKGQCGARDAFWPPQVRDTSETLTIFLV